MITSITRRVFLSRSALGAVAAAMLLTSLSWADGNSEIRLRTQLSGGALNGKTPSGHADFRSEPARKRARLNVEVEDVNLPDGTVLEVFLTDQAMVKIGEITLKAGFGELELNSQDGDTVPDAVKGDVVTVKVKGGATILAGTF